jgi:hypothetical protein
MPYNHNDNWGDEDSTAVRAVPYEPIAFLLIQIESVEPRLSQLPYSHQPVLEQNFH